MRIPAELGKILPRTLSRVALGLHATPSSQATSFRQSLSATDKHSFHPGALPIHIRKIYDATQNAWNELVDHPFPEQMAKGTASLNSFRHYMIQDAKYLEYYARVKMESIANSGSKASFKDLVDFAGHLSKTLGYSADSREICTQQLGVPEDVVANEAMSTQLHASINLYESIVKNPKGDWLAMNIVLLPCIMGYYAIGSKLLEDPKVITNTPYFPLWIQANSGGSSVKNHIDFINDNIESRDPSQRHWDYWIQIFKDACGTEKGFLDLGLKDTTYEIIPSEAYIIRNHGDGRFLSLDAGKVIMREKLDESGLWMLLSSEKGCNIMNHKNRRPLVAIATESFPSYCQVECTHARETHWSIYPGMNGYHQLLWSPQLQFALSTGVSGKESRVIAANNYHGTDQTWILEPATRK